MLLATTLLDEVEAPSYDETASLAKKFHLDNHCEPGQERQNWLAAEYMLIQKHLIQCQINRLHGQELRATA